MSRVFSVIFVIFLIKIYVTLGMTRDQLRNTMRIMKNQCMGKNGVTNDEVSQIEQGVFFEEHNVMCYIACIFKNIQVVRNNRLDKDLISRQVDVLYPLDMKEPVKASVKKCIKVQDLYEDACEGIFYATRCLYSDDPSNFIFP